MFIKIVNNPAGGNASATFYNWHQMMQKIFNGTYTTVADIANGPEAGLIIPAACAIIGELPICNDGVTSTIEDVGNTATSTSSVIQAIDLDLRHPQWTSTYQYGRRFTFTSWDTTYHIHGRTFPMNTYSNGIPVNGQGYYALSTNSTNQMNENFAQTTTLIWLNKWNIVWQQYTSTQQVSWSNFFHEATPASEKQYTDWYQSCPAISIGSFYNSAWHNPGQTDTSNEGVYVGATSYVSSTGTQNTSSTGWNDPYNRGVSWTENGNWATLYPRPVDNIIPMETATGHEHPLLPVYVDGHMNTETAGYPYNARIPYLYRTSDDIAAPGSLITFGGVQYAVWRLGKCGGAQASSGNTQSQTYLIPTTIDGR